MSTPSNPLSAELDSLLASFTEADRPAMRQLLERNPSAADTLGRQSTIYRTFVDGDTVGMAAAVAAAAPAPVPVPVPVPAPAAPSLSVSLDQVTTLLNERMTGLLTSPQFTSAVEARAKEISTASLAAARTNLIGAGAEVADELYSIRSSHTREFGAELDSTKFKAYFLEHSPAHGNSLTKTYDAFVAEDRTNKRIADAVAAALAGRATSDVPGTTLPSGSSPAAAFIEYNTRVQQQGAHSAAAAVNPGATTPATPATPAPTDAESVSRAFAAMRGQWTN
jgi:hypothetical protein